MIDNCICTVQVHYLQSTEAYNQEPTWDNLYILQSLTRCISFRRKLTIRSRFGKITLMRSLTHCTLLKKMLGKKYTLITHSTWHLIKQLNQWRGSLWLPSSIRCHTSKNRTQPQMPVGQHFNHSQTQHLYRKPTALSLWSQTQTLHSSCTYTAHSRHGSQSKHTGILTWKWVLHIMRCESALVRNKLTQF